MRKESKTETVQTILDLVGEGPRAVTILLIATRSAIEAFAGSADARYVYSDYAIKNDLAKLASKLGCWADTIASDFRVDPTLPEDPDGA